jgi:hypothetical protein
VQLREPRGMQSLRRPGKHRTIERTFSMNQALVTLALAATLGLHAGTALAQEKRDLSPALVQQLALINRLVALGDERRDPVLLLAAASLQKSLGLGQDALPTQSTEPDAVLARAKALAVGRPELQSVVEELSSAKAKGTAWRFETSTGRLTYRF